MGITISADETAPIPRPTTIALECDGDACAGRFQYAGDYVEAMQTATASGWLTRLAENGRLFLCPICSGKR